MTKQIFVRVDVDNAGDSIELSLLKGDSKNAQKIHDDIRDNINLLIKNLKGIDSITLLMMGCDDILFSIEHHYFDLEFLEKIKEDFRSRSGLTLSIGVGSSIVEAMINLRIAKVSGKDKIVRTSF